MAFSSESSLTFGSTGIAFSVVTLLDYALSNEKAGAFDYRRKESISLQGYFSNRESSLPIGEHFRQVKLLIENSVDFVDLKLNGLSYGKVRFLSFSFPASVSFDENSVRFSKFNIQLEILKDDSSGTFAANNLPSSVSGLTNYWYKLKGFTESFSFKRNDDGSFAASHNLSFGFDNIDKDSSTNVVSAANAIANAFLQIGLDSLSSIKSFYSNINFQISVDDYGSSLVEQTVDLINYNFSYSKNYSLLSDNNSNTSETLLREVSYKGNGIIEVTEKGRVLGKGTDNQTARANAIARLESNLASSYTRCNSTFTSYLSTNYSSFSVLLPKYDSSDTLQSNALSITKDLSEFQTEVGYEVKYSTHQEYNSATRIHSYSVSLKRNTQGVVEASIDGSVKYYTNKNKTFYNNIIDIRDNIINISISSENGIISPYYKKLANTSSNYSGIKVSTQINSNKFGVETSYSKSFSNSQSLTSTGNLIRSAIVTENNTIPVNRFSTTNVPNGKEIIYQTRQLTEGSKSINLDLKVDRSQLFTTGTGVNNDETIVFGKIKDLLTTSMLDKTSGYILGGNSPLALILFSKIYNERLTFGPDELTYFLDELRLSFDNSYNIKASLNYKYLAAKEKIN